MLIEREDGQQLEIKAKIVGAQPMFIAYHNQYGIMPLSCSFSREGCQKNTEKNYQSTGYVRTSDEYTIKEVEIYEFKRSGAFRCYECLDSGRRQICHRGPGDERESDYVRCHCQPPHGGDECPMRI